jgi:dGTPase
VNHDVEDAVRAGIISQGDLPKRVVEILGRTHTQRINTLVCDIIDCSWPVSGHGSAANPTIGMTPDVVEATNTLRQFLFDRVYYPSLAREDAVKAVKVLRLLCSYFLEHEDELPPEFAALPDSKERKVVDYVAGMTDQYALRLAEEVSR